MAKKWIVTYFLSALAIPSLLMAGFYYYDPLMLFHKPFNRPVTLAYDMRIQAAGIINSLHHDSYIVGSSMLENTSAREASKILGGNFANISISGGNYIERSYLLDYALKKKEVKAIIYSLDKFGYQDPSKTHAAYPLSNFSYLYADQLSKVKFYLQEKYIKCLLALSDKPKCIGKHITTDMPLNWMHSYSRSFGGIDNWFRVVSARAEKERRRRLTTWLKISNRRDKFKVETSRVKRRVDQAITAIENTIITYVLSYPNTQFHLIFPPYSRIQFVFWYKKEPMRAKVYEAVVRYFAEHATTLPNLSVYGYADQNFLDDIANYRDLSHYHQRINQQMLHDIANKRHLLTRDNVDSYLKKARKKAMGFNLRDEFTSKVEAFFASTEGQK